MQYPRLQISRHSFYDEFLRIGKSQPGALYLEVACCCKFTFAVVRTLSLCVSVGSDVRKAIADGYPIKNVIASDLYAGMRILLIWPRVQPLINRFHEGFWEQGHSLYKSSPGSFPVPFVQGDLLSPEFIHPRTPYYNSDEPLPPRPPLTDLASLTPLQGHLTFVYASLLFHLFDKAQQAFVAKSLASLLSPQPGSTIFGLHVAQPTAGTYTWSGVGDVYCHSPETWTELWNGEIFRRGTVRVHTKLKALDAKEAAALGTGLQTLPLLEWSVTRIWVREVLLLKVRYVIMV